MYTVCMEKQDCVSKLVDGQDESTLGFTRDILFSISRRRRNAKVCSLVERRSGDDTCNKMVNDMHELIQFGEGYRENLSKGLQAAGGCGKVNTSSQQSNPENFEHTLENFIKEKVHSDLKDETEKKTRRLKEFIIEDLKPAIKSAIEGKLITDVNHAVSDVKVTVLAELLKCKSEIYELKESQLRLDQQSFNSSKSAGNLSETGPNSGVHGSNITTSVDFNSFCLAVCRQVMLCVLHSCS